MHPPNSEAAPSPPPPAAARRPEIFVQLDRFWQRVTEGLEISQLWKQFSADARASYRLYHRDFRARAPQGTQRRNTPGQLAVADVAGKSIPAALLMATFQASLKTLSATSYSLADLVTGMNHYACTNSQSGLRFTTAFLAEFDPDTRALVYINAGHNAPILRRTSGAIERLSNGGLPLGMWADKSYESGNAVLQPGDWLVIFTDGVVEAVNGRDEEYGEQRMLNVVQAGAAATPDELLRRVMSDLDAFVGSTPQHDDVTCMLVKAA